MEGYSSYRASNSAAWKLFDYFNHENPHLRVVQLHPGLVRTSMADKFAAFVEEHGLPWDDGKNTSISTPLLSIHEMLADNILA